MEEDGAASYDLRAPATAPGESITSQLQREILGDKSPLPSPPSAAKKRRLSTPTRPTPANDDAADLVALSTPEPPTQPPPAQPAQPQEWPSSDRRRTLSPSKALAFFAQEGISDSLLSAKPPSRRDTVSPETVRKLLRGLDDSSADASSRRASVAAALGLENAADVDDTVLNEYLADVARTKEYLASSKQALASSPKAGSKRQRSLDTSKDRTADQDSFTDAFFSTKLMSREEPDDASKTGDDESNRRTTLEPNDAQSILSEMRAEVSSADAATAATPPPKQQRSRLSPSPTASPNTRSSSRKRRATMDPNDLVSMSDASTPTKSASVNNRRETLGDGGLLELQREIGIAPPSPPPSQTLREDDAQFRSPPPTQRGKTPLKSCLSARKAAKVPTPSKSVAFGPSQGAEFNLGSPSTSMTPMPARDARAMFPLADKNAAEEEEDEETSLNTSILDEADANSANSSSSSEDEVDEEFHTGERRIVVEPATSAPRGPRRSFSLRGVSPLDNQANARRQRRLSSTNQNNNGSPLMSARNRRAAAAHAAAALARPPTAPVAATTAKSPFLSEHPAPRTSFADSSASSDDGEDMELTGDFSTHAAVTLERSPQQQRHLSTTDPGSPHIAVRRSARRRDSLFADSPLSEGTTEFGSLKDLLEEADDAATRAAAVSKGAKGVEEEVKKNDDDDDEDVLGLGSLGDIAKEGEEADQPPSLAPIQEADDEDRRSSGHSLMSIDADTSSDEDHEYESKRETVTINLAARFERSATPKEKEPKPVRPPARRESLLQSLRKRRLSQLNAAVNGSSSPSKRAAQSPNASAASPVRQDPLTAEQVLERAGPLASPLVPSDRAPPIVDASALPAGPLHRCVAQAAVSDTRYASAELASWVTALRDSHATLSHEKLSRVFSPADDHRELVRELHAMETQNVRGGASAWRAKLETRVHATLRQREAELESDLRSLQTALANDRARRDRERESVRELLARERQLAALLDAAEEQQAVQREFAASVAALEQRCSSLALEASVLDARRSTLLPAQAALAHGLGLAAAVRKQTLAEEEELAVRERLGLWRVAAVAPGALTLNSRFDDVLFALQATATIKAAGENERRSGCAVRVAAALVAKTQSGRRADDVVAAIATALLREAVADHREEQGVSAAQLPRRLAAVGLALRRVYAHIASLRALSTTHTLRLDGGVLWVDFVRFPRPHSEEEGLKFSVGHEASTAWPFVRASPHHVEVLYGEVAVEQIRAVVAQEAAAEPSAHEYLGRVCRRIHAAFIEQ